MRKLRGTVRKQVTNGSKTAVMDVIGFLCASLGTSSVKLHDSLGSRRAWTRSQAVFSSQNGDRAWGVYYRRAAFCCTLFCGQKGSVQRKYFLFTVGSVCRVKRVTTGWQKFPDDEEVETEVRKWLRQQSKVSYAAGFDAVVKRRNKCTNVGEYVEK
jgi:hypothetical protein